jgi:hypothetical protein
VLVATPIIQATQEARDQEELSSKPAQANSSRDTTSKAPIKKRAGGVALSSKLQYHKKKRKKITYNHTPIT